MAADSPLEGDSVPGRERVFPFWRRESGEGPRRRQKAVPRRRVPKAEPRVRIRLPPAASRCEPTFCGRIPSIVVGYFTDRALLYRQSPQSTGAGRTVSVWRRRRLDGAFPRERRPAFAATGLSLAANRATRATTELTVAGGPRDRILLPPSARCEPDFLDEVDKAVVDYPGLRVQPHASWAGAGWL